VWLTKPSSANIATAMTRPIVTMSTTPANTFLPLRRIACARCGAEFDCGSGGSDGTCWCMDEAHRMAMPSAAREDCLCPACLWAAALTQPVGRPA
jgi:hypothetical protein